jgi:hypothetical protein
MVNDDELDVPVDEELEARLLANTELVARIQHAIAHPELAVPRPQRPKRD